MRGSDAFQEDAQHHLAAGDVPAYMQALGQGARAAASALRRANTHIKNQALEAMAQRVAAARSDILQANAEDMQRGRDNGLDNALLDRLALND
ncbi:MAG: gamma-glutamyl-phosphate reductase, partial [Pseudomonadota bacterium]|nr:gamma-glutamyl-phosphate reductase [Pseudomonadota bacterium]